MKNNLNEPDRVRGQTSAAQLREIDEKIQQNVRAYGSLPPERIAARIQELEEEWSMERYLQMNASIIGMGSALLGVTASRKWLLLTGTVMGFFMQHAVQGWCPPLPIFRKRGVRTRGEIDREIYALKALRGDFQNVQNGQNGAGEALRAAMVREGNI